MATYTPKGVYNYASDGDSDRLTTALMVRGNRVNWYTDHDGYNALHRAISNDHYNCIDILINSGIDLNSKSNYNDAALDLAAEKGYVNYLNIFLSKGTDINNRTAHNRTALTWAANHIRMLSYFVFSFVNH